MKHSIFFVIATVISLLATAQHKGSPIDRDSVYHPRKAAIYSAILPGLGQVYNRKYWKVPIVYTAIGIPIYTFFDNKKKYRQARYALAVAESTKEGTPSWNDSVSKVSALFLRSVNEHRPASIMNFRNEIRKDMDYSILFTLLFWGLNVIDATVDAHLKKFSVSDNLAIQVKPTIFANQAAGVSVVF